MRLFLAFKLPEPLRRAAAAAAVDLRLEPEAWRIARESGLHVTLRFLGEVEPARISELHDSWQRSSEGIGVIPLRLSSAGAYPERGRPRVIWLGVVDLSDGGSLFRLARRLEEAARAQGFQPETRPFAPHVTLARARDGGRPGRLPSLSAIGVLGEFAATRVLLFRTMTGPAGASYVEEAAYPLDEGPLP